MSTDTPTYVVEIKPEWGGSGYEWRILRNPKSNTYQGTILSVLEGGGFSAESIKHTDGRGVASTRDEAEVQAKLAIDLEEARRALHEAQDDDLKARVERFLVTPRKEATT